MKHLSLGTRVKMTGTVQRNKEYDGRGLSVVTFTEAALPPHKNVPHKVAYNAGVIVGKRTVQAGHVDHGPHGDKAEWLPAICETHDVWLVAFSLHRRPVMCFDHQVTPVAAIHTWPKKLTDEAPELPGQLAIEDALNGDN